MHQILQPEVLDAVMTARPELTKEQAEAVAVFFASTATTLNAATAEIPMPFTVMYGANLFAMSLLPMYLEHNLVNVEAVTEYITKVNSGEIKVEEEGEVQDRKARPKGKIGFQFGR